MAGCIWSVGTVSRAVHLGAAGGEHLGEGFHIRPGLRGASVTSRDEFRREARAQVAVRVNKEEPRERGYVRELLGEEAQRRGFPRTRLPNNKSMPGSGKIKSGRPAVAGAHSHAQRM